MYNLEKAGEDSDADVGPSSSQAALLAWVSLLVSIYVWPDAVLSF